MSISWIPLLVPFWPAVRAICGLKYWWYLWFKFNGVYTCM